MNTRPIDPNGPLRLDGPWAEVLTAVGFCLHQWTALEGALSSLFLTLNDVNHADFDHPLRAAFESVQSFNVRLGMVASHIATDTRNGADIRAEFKILQKQINRAAGKRHEAAHFLLTGSGATGKPTVHAIKPFFKMSEWRAKTGTPALTADALKRRALGTMEVHRRLGVFRELISERRASAAKSS